MQLVLVVVSLVFFLGFYNRFAGVRSGDGEFTSAVALLAGKMPYRDYYTTAPPLNLVKSAVLLKLFGPALIVSRLAGVVERLVIALVLFHWLRRMFRPIDALVASAVTIILSAGDQTDPVASYNHEAILWAMLCGLAASVLLDGRRPRRRLILWAMVSGVCASLSFLTKQTIGAGVAGLALMVVAGLLWRSKGRRASACWSVAFAAGFVGPLVLMSVLLWRAHLLGAFCEMLFVQGPAAKAGHATEFFTRELKVAGENDIWVLLALLALALSLRAISRSWTGLRDDEQEHALWIRTALVGLAGLVVIGLAAAGARTGAPAFHSISKSAVYYTFLGMTVLILDVTGVVRSPMSERRAQCVLFCAVSWAVAFTLSLSWPAFEAMLLPGLGLMVAAVLDGSRRFGRPLCYAACSLLVFFQVRDKWDLPFTFDYLNEPPVAAAVERSSEPMLRGMRLPASTIQFLEGTAAIIRQSSRPEDSVFTYPEMSLVYAMSGRMPPTFALSHNMDVVDDRFALKEAARLRQARPAVIVTYRLSEEEMRAQEVLWREGRRSGQRDLRTAVDDLAAGYRLAATYILTPDDPPIEVYVRK